MTRREKMMMGLIAALVAVLSLVAVASAQTEPRRTFSPNEQATRAEVVTFMHRTYMLVDPTWEPSIDVEEVFSDVPADSWYADPVAWAWEFGITTGTGFEETQPD